MSNLLIEIIEARAFTATKLRYDDLKGKDEANAFISGSTLAQLVREIDFEIAAKEIEAERNGSAADNRR